MSARGAADAPPPHSVPELGWWAERIAGNPLATRWQRAFCTDFAKRARWASWRPTAKQEGVMRRLVAERLEDVEVLDVE